MVRRRPPIRNNMCSLKDFRQRTPRECTTRAVELEQPRPEGWLASSLNDCCKCALPSVVRAPRIEVLRIHFFSDFRDESQCLRRPAVGAYAEFHALFFRPSRQLLEVQGAYLLLPGQVMAPFCWHPLRASGMSAVNPVNHSRSPGFAVYKEPILVLAAPRLELAMSIGVVAKKKGADHFVLVVISGIAPPA
jgi:hypothetical protein